MIRTRFDLVTTEMFLDVVFSKYNVYNVVFTYHGDDVSTVPSNIISLSKFHLAILREVSDCYCKFTFVSPLDVRTFDNMMKQLVRLVSKIDDCVINYE